MKILVCVKVVKGELNPFDESALECALQLSDDVTVVSMGPKVCENALKPLTRLGAKVILISDNCFAGADTLATSYILSTAIKEMDYDLILCGRQSIDGDTAQVGPMLSQMLGIPLITNALEIQANDGIVFATTRLGEERAELPALVTAERGYVLRFPSIFSKVGEVKILDNQVLGCDVQKCGLSGSPTKVLETFENERGRRKCKFIQMDELLPLVDELINQNNVETQKTYDGTKLKSVWAVGEEVCEKAKEIAEEVILIEKSSPQIIYEKAVAKKPDVILWNADFWGRRNAPIVAAMLSTGLCADCTMLETDGENLIMYRPAQGGNITAKIRCVTKPQMATVRTKSDSFDIIVSGGKGVADKIDKLNELAEKLGAEIGASRGLVDMNKLPYDKQIGLTGKTVSPKIYIAVGISGAIHHTCAIEGSTTVIAINPDKNARIFDYADFGIVENF
ncbi:MAG: FAD-binding protein [Clostridia bacterium]|nr:FAD-binding protein [Clostridia bacterium]